MAEDQVAVDGRAGDAAAFQAGADMAGVDTAETQAGWIRLICGVEEREGRGGDVGRAGQQLTPPLQRQALYRMAVLLHPSREPAGSAPDH
ncbi:hypothetical protein [Streptomyces cellulosae]|uniref:Uncharacterized protein n=1 Tax=Streptomyces cellulosae TaxID=1968 RepID=A0ABW7XY19_STRCE